VLPFVQAGPHHLLRAFQQYASLIEQEGVRNALFNERQTLFAQLRGMLREMEEQADALVSNVDEQMMMAMNEKKEQEDDSNNERRAGKGDSEYAMQNQSLTPCVQAILLLRQMASKLRSLSSTCFPFLQDLQDVDVFRQNLEQLLAKLESQEQEIFHQWVTFIEDVYSQDDDVNSVCLSMTGRLMEISMDGLLTVNFSEQLVCLLREVRQLSECGFSIPSGILTMAEESAQFYKYGVSLRNIANFYNNMEHQILEHQKPILLNSLIAFDNLVKRAGEDQSSSSSSLVVWGNVVECENYITRLQEAADSLETENRKLKHHHFSVMHKMQALIHIDLLKQKDLWKSKWQEISNQVQQVKRLYDEKHTRKWLLYLDQQMYKVLAIGYLTGIESLHALLPEIKCELVFSV
jgi:dynein heavy chain 2